jgi:putative Holliday junction resolvase
MTAETKDRILGLDYGEKRFGISISDSLGLTAQPHKLIENKGHDQVLIELDNIIKEYNISKIVCGIPFTMSGNKSETTKEILSFVKELKEFFPKIEVITWDERLTTTQAEKILIDGGVRRKKRKERIDSLAASIMLQSYLDFIYRSKSPKHEIKE